MECWTCWKFVTGISTQRRFYPLTKRPLLRTQGGGGQHPPPTGHIPASAPAISLWDVLTYQADHRFSLSIPRRYSIVIISPPPTPAPLIIQQNSFLRHTVPYRSCRPPLPRTSTAEHSKRFKQIVDTRTSLVHLLITNFIPDGSSNVSESVALTKPARLLPPRILIFDAALYQSDRQRKRCRRRGYSSSTTVGYSDIR